MKEANKRMKPAGACALAAAVVVLLAGCAAVGPDYRPPEISHPGAWNTELEGGFVPRQADPAELAQWWETLNDPVLSSLMNRALKGSLDLKEASSRVREARARRTSAGSGLFPTLDSSGSIQRSRSGDSARTLYAAGFDAAWELDLFGGTRRAVEAAEASLSAAIEGKNDTLVSLSAEVALNYVELRTFQARLDAALASLAIQEETYRLELSRVQAGLSDALSLEQARSNLESTRSRIPALTSSIEGAKNRLAVLLGERPGAVHPELADHRPVPVIPPEVPVDAPADVLRRRPDVRQAERELASQSARVGVAVSELYPKITLGGSIGWSAPSAGDLLTAGSRTYSYGPRISIPIFSAGSIRANIEVQSALQEQALIRYEAAVLTALEEVENILYAYAKEQERRSFLVNAERSAREAAELAEHKYNAGLIDFTVLLDAQRSLLTAQDELAQSGGAVTSNLVRLYKALGGGWASQGEQDEKRKEG
ncbi:MAG: efflux transporter outer membrane subunit [Desulfomonilia bacterium]|jgi:NodT family efflux transporter outer membrane factor (OMF) lipoprotein